MMRIAISVLLVAALSTAVIVQSSGRVADDQSAQSENRAGWVGERQAIGENGDARQVVIDSRPSDALALAARAEVPIFASEEVLEEAGADPNS